MRLRAVAAVVAVLALACSGGSTKSSSSASGSSGSISGASSSSTASPAVNPGDIVSDEPYDGFAGGDSIVARRIEYLSGGAIVSGAVLAPKGTPPPGGWPVISWDHGTTGLADRCAPSRTSNLSGYAIGLVPTVQSGFVVAATDYPGLGTPGLHPYLDGGSEGQATIDIVRAARHIIPGASTTWFALGHSQGGQAALFAGELAPTGAADLDLAGVIAVAPASQLPLLVLAARTPAQLFLAMVIAGVVATDSSVRLSDLLSPAAVAKADVFETGCNAELGAAFNRIDPLLAPGAETNAALVSYLARNDPGHRPSPAPVLLVQGDRDTTVAPQLTQQLLKSMCASGDTVELKTYAGAGHTDVLLRALGDIRAFVAARLAGTAASSSCG